MLTLKEEPEPETRNVIKNREIKIFLSSPYSINPSSSSQTSKEIKLFDSINANSSNQDEDNDDCLFERLKTYCAKQQANNNCDLNLIDLNFFNHNEKSVNLKDTFLTRNKYFRRILGKLILNDLLNLNNASTLNPHTPSYCIFVVSVKVFFFLF